MCNNSVSWCKGPGYYDQSKICMKCQSIDAAHNGMALKKPQPACFPEAVVSAKAPVLSNSQPTASGLLAAPTNQRLSSSEKKSSAKAPVLSNSQPTASGLLAAPTNQRLSSSKKSLVPSTTFSSSSSATRPTSNPSSSSVSASADPFARQPDETEVKWELRVMMAKKKERTHPKKLSGFVFRGENSPTAGMAGRTPQELIKHGGFQPWQCTSIKQARTNLEMLCSGTPTLRKVAYDWQKFKDKKDGYFVSTGTATKDAYDTYQNFYRISIPLLMLRAWDTMKLKGFNPDNVHDCHLFTDGPTVEDSKWIAVLCLVEESRSYEALVMTPMGVDTIEIQDEKRWVKLSTLRGS